MNEQAEIEVSVVETKLPHALAHPLVTLARVKDVFLHNFPSNASPSNLEVFCVEVEESMGNLRREWRRIHALAGIDAPSVTERDAWTESIIAALDEYLNTRVQGKYYLPAWDLAQRRRFECVQNLSKNQGRGLFSSGLVERCYEIASAAQYGLGLRRGERTTLNQRPLMECIQSTIAEELEEGVRNAPARYADREAQIVVLLQALVNAAEHGLLSLPDLQSMRHFIKMQTEMRPAYEGVDLNDGHTYIQAINRQNALLNAALPFFG